MFYICLSNLFFFLVFLGPQPQHMEVPRPGVELELQLLAYATATATPDLSCTCNLCRSSRQHQILNPLSKAKGWTHILMDASHGSAPTRTPRNLIYYVIYSCICVSRACTRGWLNLGLFIIFIKFWKIAAMIYSHIFLFLPFFSPLWRL